MRALSKVAVITSVLALGCLAGHCYIAAAKPKGNISHITVYPVTSHGTASPDYRLTVNGITVPIEKVTKFADGPVQYALMEADSNTVMNFELTTKTAVKKYSISPKEKKIAGKVLDGKLEFSVRHPQYLVVKIEGMDDLFILIDNLNHHQPIPGTKQVKNISDCPGIDITGHRDCSVAINLAIAEACNSMIHPVLYFPRGTYLSKQIRMKSNVTLYLAGGAIIQATDSISDYPDKAVIFWDHVTNSKLTGRGVIDGSGRALKNSSSINIIKAVSSKNCLVEGITERDSPFWTNHIFGSEYFNYRDIKVINYRPKRWTNNTDGLNFDCSRYCGLYNGFFYTGDDNCVVKGTGTGSADNVRHIVFDKYIGYSNSAACKIGTETTVDSISNVSFSNVDIIRCDRGLVIDAYDNAHINQIDFNNICIEQIAPNGEGSEISRPLDFLVTRTGWRKSAGNALVNRVTVKNFTVYGDLNGFPSEVEGVSNVYCINGITFRHLKNINYHGKAIIVLSAKQGHFSTNAFVKGLIFTQ